LTSVSTLESRSSDHQVTIFPGLRFVLLLSLLVAVAGCAAPARSSGMVAVAFTAPPTLRESVAITNVTSAEMKTLLQHSNVEADQLREAVQASLRNAGYLSASPAAATVLLAVALISLEQTGLGPTVTSSIRYTLTSRASGVTLFNEVVVAECSDYAFSSWERVQHSTECSVRKNIGIFLQNTLSLRAN
jgi:hypothetical protein